MCGICGVTKKDKVLIEKLNHSLSHRGPDGSSVYLNEDVSLGHNRLAIIDLSDNAKQPMQTPDGRYVLSFNGEIYNYKELRTEIGDQYKFTSKGDSEVLLAALSLWGINCISKIRGIFAFALWDNKNKELLLCRDHMGVKPLYYQVESGVVTFSSELSTFTKVGNRFIDKNRLALYFGLNYVPSGDSLVKGVKKLPAGHYLKFRNGEQELVEYFDVFKGDGQLVGDTSIYQTIDQAVSRQLVSDRPVGVFLSGGIDSSVVLHHANLHQEQVKTFSVAYEMTVGAESEAVKFNADSELAIRTAKHYGAKHTTYDIKIADVRNNLESIIQSLDDPVANPTAISQSLLSRWVREDGVVVALGGDGGDELFGGYTRHRAMMAAYYYDFLPKLVRSGLDVLHPKFKKLNHLPGLSLHVSLMTNSSVNVDKILKEPLAVDQAVNGELAGYYERAPENLHVLDQFMRVDRRTWLAEESLTRSDRSSMASGLELRVPLLDIDVVRLSDSISPFRKTTPRTGKKILRETYKNHLPDYLYNQPKRGWISPGAKWFRDPVINDFCKEVFSSGYYNGLDNLVNWEAVRTMLDDHVDKNGYYLQPLWNLLVLQVWSRGTDLNY